jgi:DNA processing protein
VSLAHWVALASVAGLGGKSITRLLAAFGTLEAVFETPTDQLTSVKGIGPRTAEAITTLNLIAVEADLKEFAARDIRVITWQDAEFPPTLLRSDDAPPVLFVRGVLPATSRLVAIVGTRTPSAKRASLSQKLGVELAKRHWIIVSGMALGIDTAAHRGALQANSQTVAVLGCGVDRIYPPANRELAHQIAQTGALLSEVYPPTTVSPQNLMARNRITSGLSVATIVIEASEDSGSVSTARRAMVQGRAAFAVAGDNGGCDTLISEGAQPLDPDRLDWDRLSEQLEAHLL